MALFTGEAVQRFIEAAKNEFTAQIERLRAAAKGTKDDVEAIKPQLDEVTIQIDRCFRELQQGLQKAESTTNDLTTTMMTKMAAPTDLRGTMARR